MDLLIRTIKQDEWEDAMALAWRTFQKYEAADYPPEGSSSFINFISDQGLYKMFLNGDYKVYAAYYEGHMIGIISIRKRTHISLLFVEGKYHRQGVGSGLIDYAAKKIRSDEHLNFATVNAAPFAVGFYKNIGFEVTGPETMDDGIRYTPMILKW